MHNKPRRPNILNIAMVENMKKGRSTLFIIDEAQIILEETFEEIRLLLNFQMNDRFLLTLVLIGQPELRDKIRAYKQLDQRIFNRYQMNYPAASCGVSKTARSEASFGEYDPERFKSP